MKQTDDRIIKLFLDSNQKTAEALAGIKEILNSLNDQNNLHNQNELTSNQKIGELASGIKSFVDVTKIIIFVLVAAIIVLAGAEKALKFIPGL